MAVDRTGRIYISISAMNQVLVFQPDGTFIQAIEDHAVPEGFSSPTSLTFDLEENLIVSDSIRNRLLVRATLPCSFFLIFLTLIFSDL